MKRAANITGSFLLGMVAHSGLALGGELTFECTVTAAHAIAENGDVVTDTSHLKSQIGSRFSVERKSGEIRGTYFINSEAYREIRVVNSPSTNIYYAIYISHGPVVSVGYLYIGNHRAGPRKPFSFTRSGLVMYAGYCQ